MGQQAEQAAIIERLDDSSDPVYANRWLRVHFDRVRFPNGSEGRYNKIVEGPTGHGVAVLPLSEDGRIAVVGQYRYPIGEIQWEIPRGFAETMDFESEARRELGEELGLNNTELADVRMTALGEVFPNSGVLATRIHVFLARPIPMRIRTCDADNAVILGSRFLAVEQIDHAIADGAIRDSITIATLQIARVKMPGLWQGSAPSQRQRGRINPKEAIA